jgi:hypothetical protein
VTIRRLALLLAAAVAAPLVATAPVSGMPIDARKTTISAFPKQVVRGKTLHVSGRGWPAKKKIDILVGPVKSESTRIAIVKSKRNGRFKRDIVISGIATPGRYVVQACRNDCAKKRQVRFRILVR